MFQPKALPNRLCWAFIAVMLLLAPSRALGSHMLGAGITYTCVNPCTTRVALQMYGDCTATCFWNIWLRWKERTPGCALPPPVSGISPELTTELTPSCPSALTNCMTINGLVRGLMEYYWYRDYDVCAVAPCEFDLIWDQCCRYPGTTSIVFPGSQGIYLNKGYINTGLGTCNNSPQFHSPPLAYFCANQDHQFSQGAHDPDGDSLVYSLIPSYRDSVNIVNYVAGYSGTQPLGPTWNCQIDAQTGLLTLQALPGNAMTAYLNVMVSEYRNGIQIGAIQREILVTIAACNPNISPTWQPITNLTGATSVVGDVIYRCTPGPICMELPTLDPNASQNLMLTWDEHLAGATLVDANNLSIQDTVLGTGANPPVGRLCFTPTANGIYHCTLRITDDGCPYNSHADKAITFIIGPQAGSSTATGTLTCVMSGATANFTANGCGPGPFTFAWSGAGGLSGSTQNLTHTYPGPGTYPWQVIVSDGNTVQDTLRDTITVVGQPGWQSMITGNLGLDSCNALLSNTLMAGGWQSYLWNNSSTSPLITVTAPGLYSVTVADANGCLFQDTATVSLHRVDITGIVRTSLGTYLQNQKIYLIQHDTVLQALNAIDSVFTDAFGYFQFCNVTDTLVFLKAAPDSMAYPFEMPTYADLNLYWNNAVTFYPLTQVPFVHNFSTLFGANPGGPGFIGGLITQGANKTSAVGDPVPGLRVFLRDANSGSILGYRDSDANGYFSFAGIPFGDYEIVPDRPLVSTTNVPALTLTSQTPVMDSLDFQLHRYWLELVAPATSTPSPQPVWSSRVMPNPFVGGTRLELVLNEDATGDITVHDIMGRQVARVYSGAMKQGKTSFAVGETLSTGMYFIRLSIGDLITTIKLVKE